jgi:ATP-dependent DNA ligase
VSRGTSANAYSTRRYTGVGSTVAITEEADQGLTSYLLVARFCIIDGEAVACDDNGVALFNRVRYRHHDESIFLYAFDLIELNGDDLRRDPLEGRKAILKSYWPRPAPASA